MMESGNPDRRRRVRLNGIEDRRGAPAASRWCGAASAGASGNRRKWSSKLERPIEAESTSELIRRSCEGDERAARGLYHRYAPRVYAVVRRIAGNDDLAKDYAQEAWIRAFRALPGFRGDARFSTWLHRIAVNAALQLERKQKAAREREAPLPEVIPVAPQVRDVLLQRRLEEALDQLPPRMRQVLVLHDVEGRTHQEIGEDLGIAAGTSKSQLFKARAKMRRMLAAYEQEAKEIAAWNG